MNIFESVYCYFYQARIDEGHLPSTSPANGNIILSLSIAMILLTIVLLLAFISPDLGANMEDFFQDTFGRSSGKTIAKIIMIPLIALLFLIIKFTIGTQSNFDKMISRYRALGETDQKLVANNGKIFFIVSMASVVLPILLHLIF